MAPLTLIDSQQRLHAQRSLMAAGYSLVVIAAIGLYHANGFVSFEVFLRATGAIATLIVLFTIVFRLGLNRRFTDRSMTMPQCMAAIVVLIYVNLHVEQGRGAFSMLYLLPLMFGLFRMRTVQLFILAAPIVLIHGMRIAMPVEELGQADFARELTEWVVLSVCLTSLVLLGGYLSELRRRLRFVATRDSLTGLINRRQLEEILDQEKDRVDRGGPDFCVAIIDIDNFKLVNDGHSHHVGDRTLREFGELLQLQIRRSDHVGRYGGDEFLLVMTQTGIEAAAAGLQRVTTRVRNHPWGNIADGLAVTMSAGIAQYVSGQSIDDVTRRADDALYTAKLDGRDSVVTDRTVSASVVVSTPESRRRVMPAAGV